MAYALILALIVLFAAALALVLHGRGRGRLYRALASQREAAIREHRPRVLTPINPAALKPDFERERIMRVEGFLSPENLAELRAECERNQVHAERSCIPGHKKGGTLSYEAIHRRAPACLAFYHSPELHAWLSKVAGVSLRPTADHDQSSCSILYYDEEGDQINWHYDHNFYKGRHFTILLSLVNRAAGGGLSAGRLMQRKKGGEESVWDTSENVLVMFEGARVLHRASPIEEGDQRIMLSMTLCTDPGINPIKELARRVKDTAYYGPRALID
jgi:hypothetical protein